MINDIDTLLDNVFGSSKTRPTAAGKEIGTESLLEAMDAANRRISEELDRQTAMLRDRTGQNRRERIEDLASEAKQEAAGLQARLESEGLAAPAVRRRPYEENPRLFTEIAQEAGQAVFGQEEFMRRFTLAMKRPFATGREKGGAENTILVCGSPHTGRHTGVGCVLGLMQKKGLLPQYPAAVVDLAAYPSQNEERLYLQDLYMALNGKSPVVLFENLQACPPALAAAITDLIDDGTRRLSTRYTMQNGRLIDAGSALVTDAVSTLSAAGKYLIFFTDLKRAKVVDRFGAPFLDALGDVCETVPLTDEALDKIAGAQTEVLRDAVRERLSLELTCDDSVARQFRAAVEPASGAKELVKSRKTLFDGLSEWKLESDLPAGSAAFLTAAPEWRITVNGTETALAPYLPRTYRGALDEVKKELESIVGLKEVKEYILSLEDHYAVQKRRRAEGMKTQSVSMHMIFTGNPGTGKTTIARIVSRYLKAVGVLTGGQLVEVTRADLVGRYVGHTAPLTRSVIESALGGVLFIDEAYALYRGEQDSFGLEAIDTLVKGMEDNRENLLVILAGYTHEMQTFLTANSGLRSRFPNVMEFPDYTGEELLAIAKINASQRGYRFAEDVEEGLLAFFCRAQAENSRENGNGRLARNKLEEAIVNQSRRLVAEPESPLDELRLSDFDLDSI